MQNGNGQGHGNGNGFGKRWLLIGLLILGGFWLVSDAYNDGFRDAMIATGQGGGGAIWRYHNGPEFPWGLIVLGGIGFIAWRKGAFDRFGGPGGPFDGGGRGMQRYGNGGYVGGQGASFRGPRGFFDDWHRQAHEAHHGPYAAPAAPPAPPAGQQYTQAAASNGAPGGGVHHAPPPPPPAPDYWASMARGAGAAEGAATSGAPVSSPPAPPAPEGRTDGNAANPAPERW